MHQLLEMISETNYIKEEFKKIEAQKWTSKEFGTELVVQVGHFADIMLRQSAKYNDYTIDENNKHLGDELSDILLNTLSIVDTSGLSSEDLINDVQKKVNTDDNPKELTGWEQIGKFGINSCKKQFGNEQTNLHLFEKIVHDSYEMFSLTRGDELNNEKILDIATKLTINSLALGFYMELNLPNYFKKMVEESKSFVDQKTQKIIDSYPYTIPRIELSIDESALPFVEKPGYIELSEEKPLPFLLLRSSGFPWMGEVRKKITEEGFTIDHEREIDEFELLARYLYPAFRDKEETYLWFLISRKAFPESYNKGYAFVLSPENAAKYSEIDSLKRRIRTSIGPIPFQIQYRGKKILADLHHIHAPNKEDYQKEYQYLATLSRRVNSPQL